MALTKDQQQKIVLAVMLVGGFGYVFWNYMWVPTNAKIASLSKEVEELQEKVNQMERIAKKLPRLKREYEALLEEVGKTEKRLPKSMNVDQIIRLIEDYSKAYQIEVQAISPGSQTTRDYYVEIPFTLRISGRYETVARFLADLGQEERIFSAQRLNLNAAGAAGASRHTVTGSFVLMAYMFRS